MDDSCEEHERHLEKPKETGKDFCLESLLKNRSTKDWEWFLSAPILRDESKKQRNWLFHDS